MIKNEDHGGGCCGIMHLFSFDGIAVNGETHDSKVARVKVAVEKAIDTYDMDPDCFCDEEFRDDVCDCDVKDNRDEWRCAVEAVLAGYQLASWRSPLEECGFKEVFSFHNSNSGNRCHVFYLETNSQGG